MIFAIVIIIILLAYVIYEDIMKEVRVKRYRVELLTLEHDRDMLRGQVKTLQEQVAYLQKSDVHK